jgi:hypothetical protein
MDLTCTGGGISLARMFVSCGHFWFLSALVVCSALRGARERIAIDNIQKLSVNGLEHRVTGRTEFGPETD